MGGPETMVIRRPPMRTRAYPPLQTALLIVCGTMLFARCRLKLYVEPHLLDLVILQDTIRHSSLYGCRAAVRGQQSGPSGTVAGSPAPGNVSAKAKKWTSI